MRLWLFQRPQWSWWCNPSAKIDDKEEGGMKTHVIIGGGWAGWDAAQELCECLIETSNAPNAPFNSSRMCDVAFDLANCNLRSLQVIA